MSVIETLIRTEEDGSLSFGNYELGEKTKKSDFELGGSLYKVKTFKGMTKLEKDDSFFYESDPGTAVFNLNANVCDMSFSVEGPEDAQITIAEEPGATYAIYIDGELADELTASLGGKLSFSVALEPGRRADIQIIEQ